MNSLDHLLRQHLSDWNTGWSMGAFGAIAEFHQDHREEAVVDEPHALTRATRRGAVRIDKAVAADIVPVAYETLSPRPTRWSQAVAFCLPEADAERARRSVLTELGPDDQAIRGIDRTGILFDMGLSLPQCDFCIRTSDSRLLTALRAGLGRSLFEHENPAMPAILAAHPYRVALTNIGRIEVYQKIGGPDTGGVSPPGPHTHLLPKLLRSGRTHSANTPIPAGLVPLGSMHPGNPVIGSMGDDREFDGDLHDQFQSLMDLYGAPDVVALKKRLVTALREGDKPTGFKVPNDRFSRAAVRLTLRQQFRRAEQMRDTKFQESVARWRRMLDDQPDTDDADDDAPGH